MRNLGRIPVLPTLLVLAAVAMMVRLGFWQLDRLHQKEALLRTYSANLHQEAEAIVLLGSPFIRRDNWYRRVHLLCRGKGLTEPRAGRNANGEAGWAHWAKCWFGDIPAIVVNVGWSSSPNPVQFIDSEIDGTIAPDDMVVARVVADRPLPGLLPSARPDPADIPNNHLSYAVQWFLFALTALVIYGLALRKRLAA